MSTTAKNPDITPIPVQLSQYEFTAFIFPHLSMPKRGPRCKIGYHRLFNLILWVLYTGMQWECLPIPKGTTGRSDIHYTNMYRAFAKWADDGSLRRRSWPVWRISRPRSASISACSMATGPTPWPKRGRGVVTRVTNTKGEKVIAITDNHGYVYLPSLWLRSMRRIWCCSRRG